MLKREKNWKSNENASGFCQKAESKESYKICPEQYVEYFNQSIGMAELVSLLTVQEMPDSFEVAF